MEMFINRLAPGWHSVGSVDLAEISVIPLHEKVHLGRNGH